MKHHSINPSDRPDGRIEIQVLTREAGSSASKSQVFTIDYDAAWSLFQNLATTLEGAALARVMAAGRIDCARCKNFRMISVERHAGRKEQVHCPDCTGEPVQLNFPPWPEAL